MTTNGKVNNRFSSYQQGGGSPHSYQQPSYAQSQTDVLTDTARTHYEAEGTANAVLTRMTEQRHQFQSAHDDVFQMRAATEKASKELYALNIKYKKKKLRLYAMIAALGMADVLLFLRIIQCRGGFFC